MPTTSRRKDLSVTRILSESPYRFSFQQAVRLLERSAAYTSMDNKEAASKPVARFAPPGSELIRFKTTQSLAFPASEISRVSHNTHNTPGQWTVNVNFMGLTGSGAVLPYHYTEFVLSRAKQKDNTTRDFFDIFNHRTVSLFYQASVKYSLPIEHERTKTHNANNTEIDRHTQILLSLIGLGMPGLQKRLYTRDESLVYYAGLFSKKLRTSAGLKQIIYQHFSIPVEIQEFIGQWQALIDDVRTRLPGMEIPRGQNNQLGKSVMLGRKGWFSQGKIRIILGPLNRKQLHAFSPGTTALKALDEIVKLYLNFEHDYDYVMRIRREDLPDRTKLKKDAAPIIGWNTWLANEKGHSPNNDATVDIPVSAARLR
ncbi:MAG: type VI secretion system baseplate subunit TssG [Gammaproteobacteria bacterium]|nr:type VI secretion system baseplate subunit TssG [Gammaproteobacteria bacterium]